MTVKASARAMTPMAATAAAEAMPRGEEASPFRRVPMVEKLPDTWDAVLALAEPIFCMAEANSSAELFNNLQLFAARRISSAICGFKFNLFSLETASLADKPLRESRTMLKSALLAPDFNISVKDEKFLRFWAELKVLSDKCRI
ncbi:hypothetical protein ACQRBN_16490 [Bariatricus sp. SGI.154]|uniref:hypothetical protein n=1 Tax=Bariatricus sp. SGI.154 TaxID=3420549 RepID=UPI003D038001